MRFAKLTLLSMVLLCAGCATNWASEAKGQGMKELSKEALVAYEAVAERYDHLAELNRTNELIDHQMRLVKRSGAAGDSERLILYARATERTANGLLAVVYEDPAKAELGELLQITNLGRAEMEEISRVSEMLSAGDYYGGLRLGVAIRAALESRLLHWRTKTGDTLELVSADDRVYGNKHWWPIIYHDNKAKVPNHRVLNPGLVLEIRSHPTRNEVKNAIIYNRIQRGISK